MKIFFLLLISIFCTVQAPGQQVIQTISGTVTDATTGEPVPFASILLQSGRTGTASNESGHFIFKVPSGGAADTIVVSSVGYRTVKKPVRGLPAFAKIALHPSLVELAPVVVDAESGLRLIKEAVARIPQNCDTSNVRLMAFYREDIRLDTTQLSYNEAVLEIARTFSTEKPYDDRIRIVRGRKKDIRFAKDAQLLYWISGISNGARGSLADDVVKYHAGEVSPLAPDNYKYYNYDYIGTIQESGHNLIAIEISPKKKSRKALFKVKVYLEESSRAIARLDLECTEAGVRRTSRKDKGVAYAIMSRVVGASLDYHHFEVSITYKKFQGKWYPNTITRHFEIFVNSKKRGMVNHPWVADMALVVTDIDTAKVELFDEGNIGNNEQRLNMFIDNEPDPEFWEDYNVLMPENSPKPIVQDSLNSDGQTSLRPSNRKNGFSRADTLRGKLTPLRTCFDVTYYQLDVEINLESRSVGGSNLIRFKAQEPFQRFQLDLFSNMVIDAVVFQNDTIDYSREHNAVFIELPLLVKKSEIHEVKVFYHGIPKEPNFDIPMDGGVLWDKDSLGNVWAQVVCQGSGASLWWPNKDHQSDEPDSMAIWITVPSGYFDVSNGRLDRTTLLQGNRTRYEWRVTYPINNYNVTFNIGKYAHYRDYFVSEDTLTIDYYVMPYNLKRSRLLFSQVKPMLGVFEKRFGKYPFTRDGFSLVESLYPMEHQSGVCMGKIPAKNPGEPNLLLWHESAHEWWGNSLTTKDIADMWIHEAFATYAELLVLEDLYGEEAAESFIADQVATVRNEEPLIGVYDVNHIFYDIGDMYSKGTLVLHTLRKVLNNDEVWYGLLKAIQEHFRYQVISSDELVKFINGYVKQDFTYFFDQYLRHTTLPELQVELVEQGSDLVVRHRWRSEVENFRMPIKVYVSHERMQWIYPTNQWQSTVFQDTTDEEFHVDDESFYITVTGF